MFIPSMRTHLTDEQAQLHGRLVIRTHRPDLSRWAIRRIAGVPMPVRRRQFCCVSCSQDWPCPEQKRWRRWLRSHRTPRRRRPALAAIVLVLLLLLAFAGLAVAVSPPTASAEGRYCPGSITDELRGRLAGTWPVERADRARWINRELS